MSMPSFVQGPETLIPVVTATTTTTTTTTPTSGPDSNKIFHLPGGRWCLLVRRFWERGRTARGDLLTILSFVAATATTAAVAATTTATTIETTRASSATDLFLEELHDMAEQSLLFWSTFEFSVDAALQFVGPVDSFLRYGSSDCVNPHDSSTSACIPRNGGKNNNNGAGGAPFFFDELVETMGESVDTLVKNLSTVLSTTSSQAAAKFNQIAQHLQELDSSYTDGGSSSTSSSSLSSLESLMPRGGGLFGGGSAAATTDQYVFSLYQKGDGSDTDPDGIPTRFVQMHKGNRVLASKSLSATLKWRQEHDIDHILVKPHPKFDICKAVFPHYFLGRDHKGDVIFLQRPALMDIPKGKKNGLTMEEMLMHYVYVNEYLWQILEGHKPLGTMISILDLTGLQLSVLRRRDILTFLKKFVQTMDSHFPQRAHKTLIINAPKWVNALYKLCTPLMRESTKSKIEIHSVGRKQDEALKKYLSQEARQSLPASFWSTTSNKNTKRKGSHNKKEDIVVVVEDDDDTNVDGKNNKTWKKKKNNKKNTKQQEAAAVTTTTAAEKSESSSFHSKLEEDLRAFVSPYIFVWNKSLVSMSIVFFCFCFAWCA